MALELIAAIVAAIALGGMAYALRRLTGERLPKWFVTVSAAVGLIGFTLWSEYDWFNRVSAELPEGMQVVWTGTEAMPLRPWTFVVPLTSSFVAMDVGRIAEHPKAGNLRIARLFNFARWKPVRDTLMVFDCAAGRQVLVTSGVEIDDAGVLSGAEWVTAGEDDGYQQAACVGS